MRRQRSVLVTGAVLLLAASGSSTGCSGSCNRNKNQQVDGKSADAAASPGREGPSLRTIEVPRQAILFEPPPSLPLLRNVRIRSPGKAPRRALAYSRAAAAPAGKPGSPPATDASSAPRARTFTITARVEARELKDGQWTPRIALPELRYGLELTPAPDSPAGAAGSGKAPAGGAGEKAPAAGAPGKAPAAKAPAAGAPGKTPAAKAPAAGAPGKTPAGKDVLVYFLRGLPATIGEATNPDPRWAEHARRGAGYMLDRYNTYLADRRVTLSITTRGFPGQMTLSPDLVDKPEGERTRRLIEQLLLESVVHLPDKPVGPGARWSVTTVFWRDNCVVTQTAQYELVSAAGNRLKVAVTLTQNGEPQIMSDPDLPPGLSAELVALFWQARGTLDVDLGSVTPMAASLEVELRVHSRATLRASTIERYIESLGTVTLESTSQASPPAR